MVLEKVLVVLVCFFGREVIGEVLMRFKIKKIKKKINKKKFKIILELKEKLKKKMKMKKMKSSISTSSEVIYIL